MVNVINAKMQCCVLIDEISLLLGCQNDINVLDSILGLEKLMKNVLNIIWRVDGMLANANNVCTEELAFCSSIWHVEKANCIAIDITDIGMMQPIAGVYLDTKRLTRFEIKAKADRQVVPNPVA